MNDLSAAERGYLAGILDGEGCITILRHRTGRDKAGWAYGLVVVVAMTDEAAIRYMAALTGIGSVMVRKPGRKGYKPQWVWQLRSRASVELLTAVADILIVKREQAQLGLEFVRFCSGNGAYVSRDLARLRQSYFERMSALK